MTKRLSFFIILSVVALDKLSKWWVLERDLEHNINSGGAFSLLDHWPYFGVLPFLALSFLFLYYFRVRKDVGLGEKLGFTLVLSGSLSNILDRLMYGGVVDFVRVTDLNWFNLADVAITAGVVILLWTALVQGKIKANGAESRF